MLSSAQRFGRKIDDYDRALHHEIALAIWAALVPHVV